jgi:hypothetical protein
MGQPVRVEIPILESPRAIARHIDLVLGPAERDRSSILFALCDDRAYPLTHAAVDDLPLDPPPEDCVRCVEPFARALAAKANGHGGRGSMLVVLTRPAPRDDLVECRWYHAVRDVCDRFGLRMLGVYLATHDAAIGLPAGVDGR